MFTQETGSLKHGKVLGFVRLMEHRSGYPMNPILLSTLVSKKDDPNRVNAQWEWHRFFMMF